MKEDYKNMSFYERIMTLRAFFAKRQVRGTGAGKSLDRTGENEEDFEFIQLSDFLPEAELRCMDLGLFPVVSFEGLVAEMTVYDELSDRSIKISTPTCSVKPGSSGQLLQAVGAQISYSRRYLWYMFLDLCTHDELDEGLYNQGKPQKRMEYQQKTAPVTAPQQIQQAPVQQNVQYPPQQNNPYPSPMPQAGSSAPQQNPARTSQYPPQQGAPVQGYRGQQTAYQQGPANTAPPVPGQAPVRTGMMDATYPFLPADYVAKINAMPKESLCEIIRQSGISIQELERSLRMPIAEANATTLRLVYLVNSNEMAKSMSGAR